MAEKKSVQITNRDARPQVQNDAHDRGQSFKIWFDYVAATFNNGDTLKLCEVPAGSKIVGGKMTTDGLAASTTIALGDGTTAAKYLAATAIGASATETAFAVTLLLGFGEEVTTAFDLTATLGGANATDGKVIRGYIEVMIP